MPIPYGLGMSIGIHSICTTYCFFTSTIDKQPHHNITVICAVSVMFVSVFANCAVDLHNNSISTRNVKPHIFKIYIYIFIEEIQCRKLPTTTKRLRLKMLFLLSVVIVCVPLRPMSISS